MSRAASTTGPWLFSKGQDLLAFTAPAVVGVLLIASLPQLRTGSFAPPWLWLAGILLVDVAHVWTTIFVTYLDSRQRRTHRARYLAVPITSFAVGTASYYLGGASAFWRLLAYFAVFHFVRQQAGWLSLYRLRMGERHAGKYIDLAAIYAATLYPLLWWHVHLPRNFVWFVPGDFFPSVDAFWLGVARPAYWAALGLYAGKAAWDALRHQPVAWGKHCLVATTAMTWHIGIIATNSEAAFTITNVFTHGIPYMMLIQHSRHALRSQDRDPVSPRTDRGATAERTSVARSPRLISTPVSVLQILAVVWLLAYVEEWSWNQLVWHEHKPWFAPVEGIVDAMAASEAYWQPLIVPLLAVPQLSHYLLDSMIWKRNHNPQMGHWLQRQGS